MRLLVPILFLLSASQMSAATYYVATNGNNSADGSIATPWLTIQHAADSVSAGDTVLISHGAYEEAVQTSIAGTTGNRITLRANPTNTAPTLLYQIRLQNPYYTVDGLTFHKGSDSHKNASASWGADIRVEAAAHNVIITNNVIKDAPVLIATNFVFDASTNSITTATGDFNAAGFLPQSHIFIGCCSLVPPTNHNTAWLVKAISGDGHTMWLTNSAATNMVTDAGTGYYLAIYAGGSSSGFGGILMVASGGSGATNCSIVGNTFTNLMGSAMDIVGDGHTIANNRVSQLHSLYLMRISSRNTLIQSNLFLSLPGILFYTQDEIANIPHPPGAGWFDYQDAILQIAAQSSGSTNIVFDHNWFQGVDNQLATIGWDAAASDLTFRNNVFCGIGAQSNSGWQRTSWIGNTWYKSAFNGANAAISTGGADAGKIIQVNISSNLFIGCGDSAYYTNTSSGFYGLSQYLTNSITNWNFVATPEGNGWRGKSAFAEPNGISGGDPCLFDEFTPLGADGLPFTADDGLRPLPSSGFATNNWGALPTLTASGTTPYAHFSIVVPSSWAEATGTNYDPVWLGQTPWVRGHPERPWTTIDALTNIPFTATFTATNSVSGTMSLNSFIGLTNYIWDFGDGAVIRSAIPTVAHTFLSTGNYVVTLTVLNSYGASSTETRNYRIISSNGHIWNVATNGNDTTGNGSVATPWLTIAKAISVVTNGDYVAVHSGSYNEYSDVNRNVAYSTNRITFVGYGAKMHGAKFRYPNWTWEGFDIDDVGSVLSPLYVFQAANNVWLVNNFVHDVPGTINSGIEVIATTTPDNTPDSGVQNGIAQNNIFSNNSPIWAAVNINNGRNWLVYGNQLYGSPYVSGNDGDFVRPQGADHIIKNNYVYGMHGGHCDFFQISGTTYWASNILVEANWVQGNRLDTNVPSIAQMDHLTNSWVTNIFFRNNCFIEISGQASSHADSLFFYNNLFYRCGAAAVITSGGPNGSCYNERIFNNIFFECCDPTNTAQGWYQNGTEVQATNVTISADYDFVCGTNGGAKRVAPPNSPGYWAITGQEAHGINGGSPSFSDATTFDFHIPTNSILRSAGTNFASVFTTDFDGRQRPASTNWTIGPFEASATQSNSPAPPATPGTFSAGTIRAGRVSKP